MCCFVCGLVVVELFFCCLVVASLLLRYCFVVLRYLFGCVVALCVCGLVVVLFFVVLS